MRVHRIADRPSNLRAARWAVTLALLLAALAPAPAAAVSAGVDLFVSQPGHSHQDFTPNPIPPGFFAPGSLPFDGIIYFNGDPLGGPFGQVDTIVERLFPTPVLACGQDFIVPIEIVALSLVSAQPITVNFNAAPDQLWNVRVTLSSITMPQPQGNMTIRKTHPNGGTFSSTLYVQPKFIFTQVGNPLNTRTLDTGGLLPPVDLGSNGHWMDPAAAAGFFFVTSPGGTPLDNDLNPGTPNKIIAPTSPDFIAGMRGVGGTCETPMSGYGKTLTEEEQAWARHGVLPAQEQPPQPDGREGQACLPDRTCIITTPTIAAALGGVYGGDNQYCSGDANDDGFDDKCTLAVPAIAPLGTLALAVLLVGSGLWFVARRRERPVA
jgi:hypothetical protein